MMPAFHTDSRGLLRFGWGISSSHSAISRGWSAGFSRLHPGMLNCMSLTSITSRVNARRSCALERPASSEVTCYSYWISLKGVLIDHLHCCSLWNLFLHHGMNQGSKHCEMVENGSKVVVYIQRKNKLWGKQTGFNSAQRGILTWKWFRTNSAVKTELGWLCLTNPVFAPKIITPGDNLASVWNDIRFTGPQPHCSIIAARNQWYG